MRLRRSYGIVLLAPGGVLLIVIGFCYVFSLHLGVFCRFFVDTLVNQICIFRRDAPDEETECVFCGSLLCINLRYIRISGDYGLPLML